MYKVINSTDQNVFAHKDEEGNIVLDDYTFEIEDCNTGKQYRVDAYSLQDGTDNIRVSFDLWNDKDECYKEIGYGFYDSDGGQIAESAGEDIEDTKLQTAVIGRLFGFDIPVLSITKELEEVLEGYTIESL